jgi:hypothetical protein
LTACGTTLDAAVMVLDGGTMLRDGGLPESDGGTSVSDAGTPPAPDGGLLGGIGVITNAGACQIARNTSGDSCEAFEVSQCPGVSTSATVELRVTRAIGALRGVVMFGSGGGGTGFYDAADVPRRLASAGYTVIDRAWRTSWIGANGGTSRQAACRYATVLDYVKRTFASTTPLCASGNSGGAAELGYTLNFYGSARVLRFVMPTGGPVAARWDYYCAGNDDPQWLASCGQPLPAGFCNWTTPICAKTTNNVANCSRSTTDLHNDSLLASDAVLGYGTTDAHFMQGLNDCDHPNVPIGLLWHQAVTSNKTFEWLSNTPHEVMSTTTGQNALYNAITTRCVP